MKLAMYISTNCDWTLHILHIWFFAKNFFSLRIKQSKIGGQSQQISNGYNEHCLREHTQ